MSGPADEMIGRQVGRYRIVRHLASGGMAELYIARQEAMGGFEKEIVVKILQPKFAENPRVVQMFLDEARLAAKLNHQSIVHVYDVAEDGGLTYIAMEYIRGETLTDIVRVGLAAGKYLPLEHAVHVVRQTAAGLAYAHAWRESNGQLLRIVHRDVSPTNILVTMEGQTKIVDFGIARAQEELRDEAGVVGKAGYMSPEQVRGEAVDTRSDIFSLGIILYELTLGQRLYRGTADAVMKRIVEEKVPPPTAVRRDFPPALELIVMRALEKRPEARYQSAEEMRVDLEEFLADEGLRTGSRRMALYMKEIFNVDAGARLAAAPPAAAAGVVPLEVRVKDDSEELNFDRRAPLSLRFEAAPPEEEQSGSRFPPPLPRDGEGPSPAAPNLPPVTVGPASARRLAPIAAASAPQTNGATSVAPAAAAAASDHLPDQPPKSKRGWVVLVFLLLGAAALAFVGTR
ncbi:MAG TPA: serine/threonine-protein kinase [Polyangia bacterium]|jgi:serine/threonine protein kinase|nr:serine/threonine-protein kinase [Polyangia bacterium]